MPISKQIIFDIIDAIPALWRMVEIKTQEMFRRQLWSYCLEFFRGNLSDAEFEDAFSAAIEGQLTKAWNEGALEVGTTIYDMTDEDDAVLAGIIADEQSYITNIGVDILDAVEKKIDIEQFRTQFNPRIDIWSNRYADVVNQAKLHFGGKVKLKWTLGETEKHCSTCAALNGIIAYASEWEEAGVQPQNPPNGALECGGWQCDCSLEVTDERRSREALSRILDIAVSGNVGKSVKFSDSQPRVPAGNSDGGQWTDDDIYIQKEPGGRAAGGGVTTGINQEQYLGGQFLPQSEQARAEKLERERQKKEKQYMEKKQEIAPYVFETPPTPDSASIFRVLSGRLPYNKETQQFDDSQLTVTSANYIGRTVLSYVPRYNAGERWFINPDMPHLH